MEIRTIGPFLDYWSSVRARTRKVIADIPPDKIDWSYSPHAFTLGDLARHLATIEREIVVLLPKHEIKRLRTVIQSIEIAYRIAGRIVVIAIIFFRLGAGHRVAGLDEVVPIVQAAQRISRFGAFGHGFGGSGGE